MRFEIPRMLRPLQLSDYAVEFGDAVIQVWVNPPGEKRRTYGEIVGLMDGIKSKIPADTPSSEQVEQLVEELRGLQIRLIAWFSEIWSQGPQETRWSEEDIRFLLDYSMDTDPKLWAWLVENTMRLIGEHRSRQKKTLAAV